MSRYVIVLQHETAEVEVFGPWRSYEKASQVEQQLSDVSERYNIGGGPDKVIDADIVLVALQEWPGIRAFTQERGLEEGASR